MSLNSHSLDAAEPRKRPRQRRSREMVDRILDSAARLFDERGYRDATTNHVAEAAGVSVGSLYQYFPNKDALLVGLAERHVDEAIEALTALAGELRASDADLVAACRSFVAAAVALNDSDHLHRLLWQAPRTAALHARFERLTAWLIDELVWYLEHHGVAVGVARRRAAVIVPALDAAVHEVDLGDRELLVDELTILATGYLSRHG